MDPQIANIVTERIQTQLGALVLQVIQLQAEKEAAERALAELQAKKASAPSE